MKILFVDDTIYPLAGGSAERSMRISKCLIDNGHDVSLLTLKRDFDLEFATKNGVSKIYQLPSVKYKYLVPLKGISHINKIIRNYDIVHIANNWSLLGYFAAKSCVFNDVPYVFSPMGFITIHNNKSRAVKYLYLKFFASFVIQNCRFCITVSNREYNDALNLIKDETKVRLMPNGFVADNFLEYPLTTFRKRHNLDNKKILLFLGRMDAIKGVHLLLDAFINSLQYSNKWHLVIVGPENQYRIGLRNKALNSPARDLVSILDPVYGDEKRMAYYACDLFVIPSVFDAMTIVALEAAACGKPILITDTADFPGLALNEAGIEVSPTIEGIEKGLKFAFENEGKLKQIGANAKKYVYSNFDYKVLCQHYNDIFIGVKSKHFVEKITTN